VCRQYSYCAFDIHTARFGTESVHDIEHYRISGGQRRGEFPRRHQDREIPRNDLTDHAEWFVEVVGDRVVVELTDRAFLCPDHAGEIAEVVDRQRQVGGQRLADCLLAAGNQVGTVPGRYRSTGGRPVAGAVDFVWPKT
jgi:hypothetical protein